MVDSRSTCAVLKRPTGWFAAGREVATAITLLSDGAFKLYVFLCLRADRSSGRPEIDQSSVAKSLVKSRRSVIAYFAELEQRGVCEVNFAANQHSRGVAQYVRCQMNTVAVRGANDSTVQREPNHAVQGAF